MPVGDDRPRRDPGPPIPEWVDQASLDPAVKAALRGLDPRNAEKVGQHLVAAGGLLDDDPETALAHARAARDRASRVAAVREAVGVAAYHAGDFAESARELRAYRRMSGDEGYRAVLADCERALGRPDVALRLISEALQGDPAPDRDELVELRLVEAGARQDLDELPAALLVLEAALGGRPQPSELGRADLGRLRLAIAYADALEARGDDELAVEWYAAIAAADPDDLTGVSERLSTIIEGEDDEADGDEADEDEDDAHGVEGAGRDGEALPGDAASEDTDQVATDVAPRDTVDDDVVPTEAAGLDYDPDEDDVEAEVAELLGELPVRSAVEHDHARLFQAPASPAPAHDEEHDAPTD